MRNIYLTAIGLGVVAGMRSMSAPAFVSAHLADNEARESSDRVLRFMSSPRTALAFKVGAAGEMVADKLPVIPDRISPGPLAGRMVSGALCGWSVCESEAKPAGIGAAAAGLAAVGSAFASYYLRRRLTESGRFPDVLVALAEDAIVLTAGDLLVNESS